MSTITKVLEPKLPDHAAVKKADAETKRVYKESFDRRNGTRSLPRFNLETGYEPSWILRSSGTQKLKSLVKIKVLEHTS